jgi:hypothetical protein
VQGTKQTKTYHCTSAVARLTRFDGFGFGSAFGDFDALSVDTDFHQFAFVHVFQTD